VLGMIVSALFNLPSGPSIVVTQLILSGAIAPLYSVILVWVESPKNLCKLKLVSSPVQAEVLVSEKVSVFNNCKDFSRLNLAVHIL